MKLILGICGQPCSGKDSVSTYLVGDYKFTPASTSDMIRFYITEHNLGDLSKQDIQKTANSLRATHGADYLVSLALKNSAPRLVITGLRTPAEAALLKSAPGKLIALEAPVELRYKRSLLRGRAGSNVTFEKFVEFERKESESTDPNAQNVNAVISMADFKLQNVGTLEELHQKIDILFSEALSLNHSASVIRDIIA